VIRLLAHRRHIHHPQTDPESPMFRPLARLFTLLALAIPTLSFASPAPAQSTPHFATGFGQFAANQSDFTGGGQATHLGRYTEVGNVTFEATGTPGVFALSGWNHYTAANGDVLCAALTGTVDFRTGAISATATYVGGTGRFVNASGSSALTGQMLGGGALTVTGVGTISY
jgi:hypothetical protein